nr:serine/arginine repetitive matrix protein 1-like [Manis javanica]
MEDTIRLPGKTFWLEACSTVTEKGHSHVLVPKTGRHRREPFSSPGLTRDPNTEAERLPRDPALAREAWVLPTPHPGYSGADRALRGRARLRPPGPRACGPPRRWQRPRSRAPPRGPPHPGASPGPTRPSPAPPRRRRLPGALREDQRCGRRHSGASPARRRWSAGWRPPMTAAADGKPEGPRRAPSLLRGRDALALSCVLPRREHLSVTEILPADLTLEHSRGVWPPLQGGRWEMLWVRSPRGAPSPPRNRGGAPRPGLRAVRWFGPAGSAAPELCRMPRGACDSSKTEIMQYLSFSDCNSGGRIRFQSEANNL